MLRLYGPEATNQLKPEQIRSRGFFELNSLLNGTAEQSLADELDEENPERRLVDLCHA